jgi:response regulator RpfG family c-di-GMP phosphodiesterase
MIEAAPDRKHGAFVMAVKNKPALLVVDDEAEILYSLRGLLHKEYDFHTAQSGYEGLRVLERTPINVVMTDQRMPEMTGVDFLAQVRERFPETTRLLFTGYADLPAVIDAINQGQVFNYLTKPWEPDELRLALRQATERHAELAERRRLLADVNAYVTRSLDLVRGLREKCGAALDAAGQAQAEQLAQDGAALLGRIGKG